MTGVTTIGDMTLFLWDMLRWMLTRLPCRGTVLINFYQVGALSLPVVALTGTFIGMVLAVQSYAQFHAIGLDNRLGAVINSTLVKELGRAARSTNYPIVPLGNSRGINQISTHRRAHSIPFGFERPGISQEINYMSPELPVKDGNGRS